MTTTKISLAIHGGAGTILRSTMTPELMRVMMQMTKLDGNILQKAYDGE